MSFKFDVSYISEREFYTKQKKEKNIEKPENYHFAYEKLLKIFTHKAYTSKKEDKSLASKFTKV